MRIEKDSIMVDLEITEDEGRTIIKTTTTVKDKELFPPLNTNDKRVLDRIQDIVFNQQRAILNTREFWLNRPKEGRQPGMLHFACPCGHQFEREAPCCGEKYIKCPKCGRRLPVPGKGTQNA